MSNETIKMIVADYMEEQGYDSLEKKSNIPCKCKLPDIMTCQAPLPEGCLPFKDDGRDEPYLLPVDLGFEYLKAMYSEAMVNQLLEGSGMQKLKSIGWAPTIKGQEFCVWYNAHSPTSLSLRTNRLIWHPKVLKHRDVTELL